MTGSSVMSTVATHARRIGGPGWAAVVCMGLAAAMIVLTGRWLVAALLESTVVIPAPTSTAAQDHSARFTQHVAQFDGRSLFFVPGRPPPPPPPRTEDPRPTTPTDPPKPTSYGGPGLIGMVNDTAWFADGRRLTAGAPADRGLRVVKLNAPWNAVVEWSGVEFTVPLFDRDRVVLRDGKSTEIPTGPAPVIAPKPPEKPAETPAATGPGGTPPPPSPRGQPDPNQPNPNQPDPNQADPNQPGPEQPEPEPDPEPSPAEPNPAEPNPTDPTPTDPNPPAPPTLSGFDLAKEQPR